MTPDPKPLLGLAVAALALTGCAGESSRYPSLDIRPAERVQGTLIPVVPSPRPSPAPVDGQLIANIADRAAAAHTGFLAAAPEATAIARNAQGAEVGSAAWAEAQVALADLDSSRSQTAISLGELDILYVDSRLANNSLEAIDEARKTVLAMLAEEDRILADLRRGVR